jgi:hypothetical protein
MELVGGVGMTHYNFRKISRLEETNSSIWFFALRPTA